MEPEKRIYEPVERREHSRNGSDHKLKTYYYLVTIKCNKSKYTSLEDIQETYDEVLAKLVKYKNGYETSDHECIEFDSLGRLHKHFIVVTHKKQVYYKQFTKLGWTVNFKPFPLCDYNNVVTYIHKHDT